MAALEFGNVPTQVLKTEVMIDAIMSSLEHRPEGFHPVCVGLVSYVLPNAVPDSLMGPGKADVGASLIGVDLGERNK